MTVRVKGGTLTKMQPTGVKLREVLLPILSKMGIKSTYTILNQGVVPDVIGSVEQTIYSLAPGASLLPIELTCRSGPPTIDLYISCT